ncbi:MAG: hypothetical protein AB1746_17495 [Candidatus Zixiibacteriota bacterium]
MSTQLTKIYRVKPSSEIKLVITIGHGQDSFSTVYLEGDKIVSEKRRSFEVVLPVPGKDLKGKMLFCSTTVIDIVKETNLTSVAYELSGGKQDFKQSLEESVDKEHGVKHYVATFLFI